MEYERQALLQWSEFVKVTKFAKLIDVTPQAVSAWLKYGTQSMTDQKKKELYDAVLSWMKQNFA